MKNHRSPDGQFVYLPYLFGNETLELDFVWRVTLMVRYTPQRC